MDGKPIEPSDYDNLAKVSDPQLSPDGRTVAFVRTKVDGPEEYERTVYTVSVGTGEVHQFTAVEGDDSQPRWSPSGDRLAFASVRGESDVPQLRLLPADGGESRRVTNVVGGISELSWSPCGSKLTFTQAVTQAEREKDQDLDVDEDYEREDPDPRVIDRMIYRTSGEFLNGKRLHVYIIDLETESVERITEGDNDFVSPVWGNASTLYYTMKPGPEPDDRVEYDIVAYDTDSNKATTLTKTTGWQPTLAATTDGQLAYIEIPEKKMSMRQIELKVYDRNLEEIYELTGDLDRTLARFSAELGPQWGPDEEKIYFVTPDSGNFLLRTASFTPEYSSAGASGTTSSYDFQTASGTDPRVTTQVVIDSGTISGYSVEEDTIAFTRSEWDYPGDLFLQTDGETHRLTNVNEDYLDNHAVSEPEEISFESNGEEIQGWILRPPWYDSNKNNEQYPLLVEIHGGPHMMWSTSGTMWHEFQSIAASGYMVFWCNPRGSTGYGEEFAMGIEGNWGEVTMNDIMAGVDFVTKLEEVDHENSFVTGGSFGGFAAAWMIGQTDRFDAAVTQRGIYDLSSFYGSTDAFKVVEYEFDTLPWDSPEILGSHAPVNYVDDVDTPVLIIHAENDFRTPVNCAEMYYLFLQKNGIDTRLIRYPHEDHELSRSGEPAHIVDRLERIIRWFDGYSDHHDVPPALQRQHDAGLSPKASGSSDENK